MDYNKFKDEIIKYTKDENVDEYEIYYVNGQSISIQAYEGDVESFEHNTSIGVSFRCKVDGKIGYSATQKLSSEEAKRLVLDAKEYGAILDENPHTQIFKGVDGSKVINDLSDEEKDVTEFLKKLALNMEKMALAKDDKIKSVPYSTAEYSYSKRAIFNSHGIDIQDSNSYFLAYCEVIAEDENGKKYSGGEVQYSTKKENLDADYIVNNAVKEALAFFGAKKVSSGKYPIVFDENTSRSILSHFSSIYSSDSVQKGLSLLKDKEGEKIASDIVTFVEDPMTEMSVINLSFDDEGVKTYKKDIITNGVLNTLAYNLETASKAGKISTGNGMKYGYSSPVDVSFSNLYLKPGEDSLEEIFKKADKGIYITEMKGLHASADTTSGDFSLESKGFYIDNGKISHPIEQFTIAGNFYDLLKNITAIADNLKFSGTFGSPAFLVKELSVSGEDE